jgi:nitrate reductase gamma subunit
MEIVNIIGVIVVLIILGVCIEPILSKYKKDEQSPKCPFCSGRINQNTIICPHCGQIIKQQQMPYYQSPPQVRHKSVLVAFLLTFFFGLLGMLYSTVRGFFIMLLLYAACLFSIFGGLISSVQSQGIGGLALSGMSILAYCVLRLICIIWACNAAGNARTIAAED